MIFYFKTNGHLVYNSQAEINQGSNGVDTVYVVAPFTPSSQATARIVLPDGTHVTEFLEKKKDLSSEYLSIDGEGLTIWSFDIPYSLTRNKGTILVQFSFTSSSDTITTESVGIVVRQGVISEDDERASDVSLIEKLKKYIAYELEEIKSSNKLNKNEDETVNNQAYIKTADGKQSMMDIAENIGGSIVQRKSDGNILAGQPQDLYDATPKCYVDDIVSKPNDNYFSKNEVNELLNSKQDGLKDEIIGLLRSKQDKLTAGENVNIDSNNKISVQMGGKYELIQTIVVGYNLLESEPSDWGGSYSKYYKNVGTDVNPVYQTLTAYEPFAMGRYYTYVSKPSASLIINKEPNGNAYSYYNYLIKIKTSKNTGGGTNVVKYNIDDLQFGTFSTSSSTEYEYVIKITKENRFIFTRQHSNNTYAVAGKEDIDTSPIRKFEFIRTSDLPMLLNIKIEVYAQK